MNEPERIQSSIRSFINGLTLINPFPMNKDDIAYLDNPDVVKITKGSPCTYYKVDKEDIGLFAFFDASVYTPELQELIYRKIDKSNPNRLTIPWHKSRIANLPPNMVVYHNVPDNVEKNNLNLTSDEMSFEDYCAWYINEETKTVYLIKLGYDEIPNMREEASEIFKLYSTIEKAKEAIKANNEEWDNYYKIYGKFNPTEGL